MGLRLSNWVKRAWRDHKCVEEGFYTIPTNNISHGHFVIQIVQHSSNDLSDRKADIKSVTRVRIWFIKFVVEWFSRLFKSWIHLSIFIMFWAEQPDSYAKGWFYWFSLIGFNVNETKFGESSTVSNPHQSVCDLGSPAVSAVSAHASNL